MTRPQILFQLFSNVMSLPGVGNSYRDLLAKISCTRIVDLIYLFPASIIDRTNMPDISEIEDNQVVTKQIKVISYDEAPKSSDKKLPFRVICECDSGWINILFFHDYKDSIKRSLPLNQTRVISGKVELYGRVVQMVHPDYIVPLEMINKVLIKEPVYPLVGGISQKMMQKFVKLALNKITDFPEWLDEPTRLQKNGNKWPSWKDAILAVHNPQTLECINPDGINITRLAYDELLAFQLSLKLARYFSKKSKGESIKNNGLLAKKLLEKLPFELTSGQKHVIEQIKNDQADNSVMLRLLQGDVGSGKTVVALMAILNVIESGKQAALMAPTEILAKQHYSWISSILDGFNIKVVLLISASTASDRREILEATKNGEAQLIIGTHALFQEMVEFHNLGLAIIDEQHRFGVAQRLALTNKGKDVDTLLMTATPIPRTLTLTLYGDMECSLLKDKPLGRKPIDTRMISVKKIDEILTGFNRVIDRGEKIYWICPLIEESEKLDLRAAEERFYNLSSLFPEQVALVHGRMNMLERDQVMLDYKNGRYKILVATTVVEVGVDVPDATVIIIEHAERFGLSQLHQLRGRVGRSDKQSSCILLYDKLPTLARERLLAMRNSNDGFWLAEEDLRIRGSGDVLGLKQSGIPNFKCANLDFHAYLLAMASENAELIVKNDPHLETPQGKALKILLYLFERDVAVKYLKVG